MYIYANKIVIVKH